MKIIKCDHRGNKQASYPGHVMHADQQVIIVRCRWQATKPFRVGTFELQEGDIFLEHYFIGCCFNIMLVYGADKRLKGAYCNVSAPAEITQREIRWRDWFLDLLVLPNGDVIELDRDEFEASPLSPVARAQAEQALDTLTNWAAVGRWPLNLASTFA